MDIWWLKADRKTLNAIVQLRSKNLLVSIQKAADFYIYFYFLYLVFGNKSEAGRLEAT